VLSDGVSRRRMLKRIGAGAAVAWTAPVLSSIRTPAFAQTSNQCDPGQTCDPCPVIQACHGNSDCQCWASSTDQGGACVCTAFVANCGDTPLCPGGQPECDKQLPGSTCVQTCCGQICTPACGGNVRRSRRSGAKPTTR
jgi:hypothetical protein